MMKISNKLKMAAKVFDVFLKEDKFDMWHFKSLQMGRKVAKIGDPE